MSDTSGSSNKRETHALFLLHLVLASFYGILLAVGYRRYAYGEPGGFPVFYTAGKLARYNLRGLYDQHLQNTFHPLNDGVGYFFHLPYETLLLVPLSYLPQMAAFGLWTLLNLACLLATAVVLRRHFQRFEWLLPFAFGATLSLVVNGQDLGIVTLLIALAFDRFAIGRDVQAGAILALGIFKFPLILPLVAILAFRYRKLLYGFIALAAPLALLSFLVVGSQGVHDYVALTHGTDAKESLGILVNLRGMIGMFLGPHTTGVVAISLALIVVAAWIKAGRVVMFSLAVVVTQLVSWHAHLYDALPLLIPMGWMYGNKSRWIRHTPTLLILTTAVILARPPLGFLLGALLTVLFMTLIAGERLLRREETQ